MSPWSLIAVPLCLGVMVLLLIGISWFEQRLLSPRSLMLYTARARHVGPDTVELFIARQSEPLLRNMAPPPAPAPVPPKAPHKGPAAPAD